MWHRPSLCCLGQRPNDDYTHGAHNNLPSNALSQHSAHYREEDTTVTPPVAAGLSSSSIRNSSYVREDRREDRREDIREEVTRLLRPLRRRGAVPDLYNHIEARALGRVYLAELRREHFLADAMRIYAEHDDHPEHFRLLPSVTIADEDGRGDAVARSTLNQLLNLLLHPMHGSATFVAASNDPNTIQPCEMAAIPTAEDMRKLRLSGRLTAMAYLNNIPLPVFLSSATLQLIKNMQLPNANITVSGKNAYQAHCPGFLPDYYDYTQNILSDLGKATCDEDNAQTLLSNLQECLGICKDAGISNNTRCTGSRYGWRQQAKRIAYSWAAALVSNHIAILQPFCVGMQEVMEKQPYRKLWRSPLPQISAKLSGLGSIISLQDWEAHTVVYNADPEHTKDITVTQTSAAFWQALQRFSPEERLAIFQWSTACERLPAGGFAALTNNKLHPYQLRIHGAAYKDHLPWTQVCFYQVHLPPCCDADAMEAKLRYVLEHIQTNTEAAAKYSEATSSSFDLG